jgi:hypothetical protein
MPIRAGPKLMSLQRFRVEEGIRPEKECPESWMSARNWTAAGDPGVVTSHTGRQDSLGRTT